MPGGRCSGGGSLAWEKSAAACSSKVLMVCGFLFSLTAKSARGRPRTGLPALSWTTTSTTTNWVPVVMVAVGIGAAGWRVCSFGEGAAGVACGAWAAAATPRTSVVHSKCGNTRMDRLLFLILDGDGQAEVSLCAFGVQPSALCGCAARGHGADGLAEGGAEDATLGDDRGDVLRGGDVEGGVFDADAVGGHLDAVGVSDFAGAALLDGDMVSVAGGQVDGVEGSGDVERDAVFLGENADAVGADLV